MPWDFGLIVLVLGVVVPWLGKRRVGQLVALPDTSKRDRIALYASTMTFQWGATILVVWRTSIHFISLKQLGVSIPRPWLALICSVVLCVALFSNQILSLRRVAAQPFDQNAVLFHLARKVFPHDNLERLVFLALVVTVAICEEIIYRGFVQFLCQRLTGLAVAGILLSALLFAFAHLYQGFRGIAGTFAVGVIFATARLWTGSLVPSVAAHFATDFAVGILAPIRIRMEQGLSCRATDNSGGSPGVGRHP